MTMKGFPALLIIACAAFVHNVDAVKICKRSNVIGVDTCPPEQETDWSIEYLMRHENCHMYYQCVHGRPVERHCSSGLWFDLRSWTCQWPNTVDCTDRVVPTTTSSPAPTTTTTTPNPTTTTSTATTTTPAPTTTTTTPAPTTTTTTPAPTTTSTTTTTTPAPTTTTTTTTTTTPAPTTTTTTTTTPAPTTTTTTTTPAPTTITTTTPAPTTTTTTTTPAPTTTTTTTPAPTTTTSTTTTTAAPVTEGNGMDFQPNGCPVDPHIHWLLPHEYDCNLYYQCVWGRTVRMPCPPTLHFNPRIQVCDHQNAANCTLPGKAQWLLDQMLKLNFV